MGSRRSPLPLATTLGLSCVSLRLFVPAVTASGRYRAEVHERRAYPPAAGAFSRPLRGCTGAFFALGGE